MQACSSRLALFLALFSLWSVGCSTGRERQAGLHEFRPLAEQAPSRDVRNKERTVSSPRRLPQPSVAATSIETVAFRDERVVNAGTASDEWEEVSDEWEHVSDDSSTMRADAYAEPAELPGSREEWTLEAIEQLALQNNPSIRQASAVVAKAAGIRTQVGLKPNPTVGYSGQEIGNDGAGGQQGFFLSQTFVRGDKLAWNRQVIGHDVNAVMWQVEVQRQRVRTDIRVQFYMALAAQNRLRLARDFRNIAEQAVHFSEARVNAKEGTRPDILQNEIQLSEIDLTIQQAEFEFEAAWKVIAALAGLPNLAPANLVGELAAPVRDRDIETAYAQIVSESPLLTSAIARVDRTRAYLQRQRIQPIPNITAQLGAAHDFSTGDQIASVQLGLPLPLHNKNQGNIRAALADYREAIQNVQRLRMQIRRDLVIAMREFQIAQATVQQYEASILPKAEETLELMREAQQAGEFDFLRVLTARRTYFDVNLLYVTALGSRAQADARIDGLLLTGGLSNVVTYDVGAGLRGQTLSGQ